MTLVTPERRVAFTRSDRACPVLLLAGCRSIRAHQAPVGRAPPHFLGHYITDGSGWVSRGCGEETRVSAGDWFFCFPGQSIRYRQDPADPWCYRWIGFQGEDAAAILARAGILADTLVRHGPPDPRSEMLLAHMLSTLERDQPGADLEATGQLAAILALLVATRPALITPPGLMPESDAAACIDRACQFMISRLGEGIGAADVARHVGYERSYFSKLFARTTGTSLRDYLAALRQNQAETLLTEGALTVVAVASAVGFRDPKVFARFFKQRTGYSPGRYRRPAR